MAARPYELRSLLVATDLQADSRRIVDLAGRIAAAADASLYLLHVVETQGSRHLPGRVRDPIVEQQEADAARALESQARDLEESGVRVEKVFRLKDGPAHKLIVDRVREAGTDLVIVGSHARAGKGHRLGSTADRILRTTPVPCLVVRGEIRFPMSRVAAVTDFSRGARRAGFFATAWLRFLSGDEDNARLDLVHVDEFGTRPADDPVEDLLDTKLSREVAALTEGVGDTAPKPEGRIRRATHPVEGIVSATEEEGYDLLVVGTHGHGPVRRALVGSVAMGLAQSAPCPVLVVPPRSRS